jgi:hypothetical protein
MEGLAKMPAVATRDANRGKDVIRRCLGLVFVATLLAVAATVHADTWPPPKVEVVQSPAGTARVTITPNMDYGPRATHKGWARARVERRAGDGTWRKVWQGSLVNRTAPVDALVSDDGATLVTFDNHHAMGIGVDVVVIYDATGHVVRSLTLDQVLPAAYVDALPRSVSSLWWRGPASAIVDGGRTLRIDVVFPGDDGRTGKTRTAPLLVRLADGALLLAQSPEWRAALAELGVIYRRKEQAWARHRAEQRAVLVAPKAQDRRAWRDFLWLARERLEQRTGERVFGLVLRGGSELEGCCEDAELLAEALRERGRYAPHYLLVSPDVPGMLSVLEARLAAVKPRSLAGLTLWLPASPAEIERLRKAATASGAKVERIDFDAGMAGVELPEQMPKGYQGDER